MKELSTVNLNGYQLDQHWIGNVWLFIVNGKPNIYADIDNISDQFNMTNPTLKVNQLKPRWLIKKYYIFKGKKVFIERKKNK